MHGIWIFSVLSQHVNNFFKLIGSDFLPSPEELALRDETGKK
jgi:hypothetical protein